MEVGEVTLYSYRMRISSYWGPIISPILNPLNAKNLVTMQIKFFHKITNQNINV